MKDRELFPKSVDINPTSKCNLSCSMCWGPDHQTPDMLSTGDWKGIIKYFYSNGTDAIVFTGGEPLLRRDTPELIRFSKKLGMRVTLSTNTILLPFHYGDTMPFVDEIGVPMDASTERGNLVMREGRINSFNFQIEALSRVKKAFPNIEVTVRTVVSRRNVTDIPLIGALLRGYANLFDRWKIYQFSPFSYGELNNERHEISYQEFLTLSNHLRLGYPDYKIDTQSASFGEGRYVFVGSQGDVYGEGDDKYLLIGNFLRTDTQELAAKIGGVFDPDKNKKHAHA